MPSFRIGIDVGGTFTDLVAVDDDGRTIIAKASSTPTDQSLGVMAGLDDLARRCGCSLRDLLARTERIVHGTTVATNALLERKGADVALLTTEGHRDVLEMREGLKDDRYNLRSTPPAPLVPRRLRFGIRERIGSDGVVRIPLDPQSVAAAIADIRNAGVTSVAICYLHSYKNPSHEIATQEQLARELPGIAVSRSSDVLPQIKEFERVSTTVVNATVGPVVRRYLTSLEQRLRAEDFGGGLFIILSHGGIAPVEEAARLAAATVLSGPAGGVAGAKRCAELLATPDLIPFDVGGTSTDISLIEGGTVVLSADGRLAGERIALRTLGITSIAAGGGSIARIDAGGGLRVGPDSAGADPGPACYGRGGTALTVTDANLLLGYLDPVSFLGGRQPLDTRAAQREADRLAAPLGLSRDALALGVRRLIGLQMADGIRMTTLRRGVDPRRFALLAFGGGAGLHAVDVARELEIPRVVVPTVASVLSAWGMLASDLRYEASRTHVGDGRTLDDDAMRAAFADLEQQARSRLDAWFKGNVAIERAAEMRYGEQVFEIDVPLSDMDWEASGLVGRVAERFHAQHEALYTYASRDQEVVFVNARVAAVGAVRSPGLQRAQTSSTIGAPKMRRAHIGTWRDVPVYFIDGLAAGATIEGPAIFESETTTVMTGDGDEARVTNLGWLDIRLITL